MPDRCLVWSGDHRADSAVAGADHVALQVLTDETDHPDQQRRRLPREQYRQLAAALYGR